MGNDLSTTSNKFGLLAGLLGNTSTTTCGLAGKRTVAIHCRGGWTWNNLFVFDGPLEPEDRYDGMKIAFGADGEIFKPYREGPGTSHEKLDGPAYNKLLLAVQSRRHSWEAHKDKSRVTNDAVRYERAAPIWTWAVKQKFGLIVSGIYAVPSLFALPIVFVVKALIGDFLPAVIYLIIFAIFKVYVHIILQVDRNVYYIQIAKDAIKGSEKSENLWQSLRDTNAITTLLPSGAEAVVDVREGRVRLLNKDAKEYLLVPVIGLRPLVSFYWAQWFLIPRRFRGPLLTISWFSEGILNHSWSVAFAICAFLEASLQDDVARVFLEDTSTYSVNWFRIIDKKHDYPEEYDQFRQPLAGNWPSIPESLPWLWPSSE